MRDPEELVPTTAGHMTVRELYDRVEVLEPGIIMIREVQNGTGGTFGTMLERCLELAKPFERFAIVVDLTEVSVRPKALYLDEIRRAMEAGVHLAVTRPDNAFLRVVAGFVLARFSAKTSSHDTREQAVAACREALARTSKQGVSG